MDSFGIDDGSLAENPRWKSVPVDFIHHILEPLGFLKKYHDQCHGGDGDGNNGIKYGQNDNIDQDISFA
jgi:hypothetical protein